MESDQPDPRMPRRSEERSAASDPTTAQVVDAQMESLRKQDKSPADPNDVPPGPEHYLHLVYFSLAYAIVLFFCILLTGSFIAPMFLIGAGVYATVILIAIWSVFGAGPYWKRLLLSHLVGAIPITGVGLGCLTLAAGNMNMVDEELWYVLVIGIISVVPTTMAAQIPFWFLRGFFGWQLVVPGDRPERAFSLQDVFVLTFVFALCFAVPQTSSKIQAILMGDVDGLVATIDGETAPQIEEFNRRQRARQLSRQRDAYAGYGAYALAVTIISLISVPILMFVFRVQETTTGCAFSGLYALGFWLICASPFLMMGPGGGGDQLFVYLGIPIALSVGALAVPLMVTREMGFRLTSVRRFQRELLEP